MLRQGFSVLGVFDFGEFPRIGDPGKTSSTLNSRILVGVSSLIMQLTRNYLLKHTLGP